MVDFDWNLKSRLMIKKKFMENLKENGRHYANVDGLEGMGM